MAEQAYQLLRIIIIDSFWKGQVNELDLTGHTQLEGTNGAGKTSLMRLLPLFYGMRPSDIVSKVDQSKNFADYYLPRNSSMLIYEYQRPHQQTCLLLASSDGRGVHFKLIDASYHAPHFIGQQGKPFTPMEVERNYKAQGSFCSSFLGVDKLRQVMQNLRSGRKIKEIRQLQSRFSFSDRPSPHIDKVVNGTIEKNFDFDAVKRMLVAIASDHLARSGSDEKEQIGLNKEEISRWLADMQASRAVQKVANKIALWENDFATLEELLTKLHQLHFDVVGHIERLKQQQTQLAEQKKQQRNTLHESEAELENQKHQLQQKINELIAKIEADQSRIDVLDEDKLKFDDDDAASYQLKADQAEQYQQQLNEVIEIINSFEGDISKITAKFDALLQDLKLQNANFQGQHQEKLAAIKEQASIKLAEINQQYQQQQTELNAQLSNQLLEIKNSEHSLNTELKYLQQQKNNPQLSSELQTDIEQNRQQLSEYQQQQSQLLHTLNQDNSEQAALDKQREQQLNKLQQENRYLDELRTQCAEIEQQLLPAEGSLHSFLENESQAQGWKNSIGRILPTKLLNRTDLDPSWQGSSNNLYGLHIDLEQLQQNNALQLTEAELHEKANALDLQRQEQTSKIEQLNEHIAQLTKQLQTQQSRISEQKQLLQRCELTQQQLATQQAQLERKKQQELKHHAQQIAEKITELEQQLTANQQALQRFEDNKQEQLHQLNNQALEKRMVVESDRDSQLEQLELQQQEFKQNISERRKDYLQQKKTALDKLDPDGEVDRRTQERKTLEIALKKCAMFGQKAREYERFMSERYPNRDKLADINQQRSLEQQQLASDLQKQEQQLGSQINQLKQSLKQLNQHWQHNEELLTQLIQSQKQCEANAIDATEQQQQPTSQADLAISFCNDWLNQFSSRQKRLQQELNKFNENLRQHHSTSQLFENWQKLIMDNDHFHGAETLFKYRSAISDLLSSAAQLQKITGQSVIVNANMINEFYQHIENFGRRINQIGKKLSQSVTSLAHFEALADINVDTVMKQEELDYWGPLQQFSRHFEQSRDQLREGSSDIPEELVQAMRTLSGYLPGEGLVLEHHNLFDIEFTITEKGQVKHARNARQLKKISSTGLSYLAMLSLFAGILVMLRGSSDCPTKITLPVDELGELAAENIDLLLQMFNDNHIQMLSASPSTDRHVLALYDRHYKLKDNRVYNAAIPQSRLDELLALRNSNANNSATTSQPAAPETNNAV